MVRTTKERQNKEEERIKRKNTDDKSGLCKLKVFDAKRIDLYHKYCSKMKIINQLAVHFAIFFPDPNILKGCQLSLPKNITNKTN